jgi:hypothetical protein
MSYIGVNPQKNLRRFTQVKPLDSYPQSVLNEIKLLSFSRDKTATPFGSFIYRIQKYPGDIDLVEKFTECCSLDDVVTKFSKTLQRIVRNINKKRLHYFSEVKAGLDFRYDVNIGEMENGLYLPNLDLMDIANKMFKEKLLPMEEYKIIQYILSINQPLGADEFDTITYIFREHRILRWSDEEILKGIKKLPKGKEITLKDALTHETHVKIDMISEINGRFTEVTNFFQLAYENEDGIHLINIDLSENHDIPLVLPPEIEKLYFSNMFYSPFKMIKRLYSLGRHNLDQELLDKIIPFISSNTSLLYQIKSEIDTIILILEKMKSYPQKTIFNELDEIKLRISTILELSNDDLEQIDTIINNINSTNSKHDKIYKLKDLKKLITAYINFQTINYLEKVGLNPPPYKYLPSKHTYDDDHMRGPGENPENPYKKYLYIVEHMSTRGHGGYNVYYPISNHYPNFFEDPNSSRILSQRIINNPGKREVPIEERLMFEPSKYESIPVQYLPPKEYIPYEVQGEGTRVGAWWASFVKRFKQDNEREYPPITFQQFSILFQDRKKYNYPQMLNKIMDAFEFIEDKMKVPTKSIPKQKMKLPQKSIKERKIKIPYVFEEIPYGEFEKIPYGDLDEIQDLPYDDFEYEQIPVPPPPPMEEPITKIIENPKEKISFDMNGQPFNLYVNCNGYPGTIPQQYSTVPQQYSTVPQQHSTAPQQNIPRPPQIFEAPITRAPKIPGLEEAVSSNKILARKQRRLVTIQNKINELEQQYPHFMDRFNTNTLTGIDRSQRKEFNQYVDLQNELKEFLNPIELESIGTKASGFYKHIKERHFPSFYEGNVGGNQYAHNYRLPLYMNENLPVPKLIQSNMAERPLTGSSYATDYYGRGYGPSLKAVHIENAPQVLDGYIMDYAKASGCLNCKYGKKKGFRARNN